MKSASSLPPIILASTSPRRAELLQQLTTEFKVVPSDAAELLDPQLTAREISQINAYRKARSVAKQFADALVLGADTLVYLDQQLLGKPRDLAEARQMLSKLQGRTHEVVTGICLIHLRAHRQTVFAESTDVTFRNLSAAEIERYLSLVDPLDKAGAYAIQEQGESVIVNVIGSYSNVIGLPLERLKVELEKWEKWFPCQTR